MLRPFSLLISVVLWLFFRLSIIVAQTPPVTVTIHKNSIIDLPGAKLTDHGKGWETAFCTLNLEFSVTPSDAPLRKIEVLINGTPIPVYAPPPPPVSKYTVRVVLWQRTDNSVYVAITAQNNPTSTPDAEDDESFNCRNPGPPIAYNQQVMIEEDGHHSVSIFDKALVIPRGLDTTLGNLIPSSVAFPVLPLYGTASHDNLGNIMYKPLENWHGTDTFQYTLSQTYGFSNDPYHTPSNRGTITVVVNPVDDDPIANADTAQTTEDMPVAIAVLDNDSDVDNDLLQLVNVTPGANGTTIIQDKHITYTPNPQFSGTDIFSYEVSDGASLATAQVTVQVGALNDAPQAIDDAVSTNEDMAIEINVLANDSDPDEDGLSILEASAGSNGTTVVNGTTITYTPNANFADGDSFNYTISDGSATSSASVYVTVHPVNDAPYANADSAETNMNTALVIPVLNNDGDVDNTLPEVQAILLTAPANGTAEVQPNGILYTPTTDFTGEDTFQYQVQDAAGAVSPPAVVTITVLSNIFACDDPRGKLSLVSDFVSLGIQGDLETWQVLVYNSGNCAYEVGIASYIKPDLNEQVLENQTFYSSYPDVNSLVGIVVAPGQSVLLTLAVPVCEAMQIDVFFHGKHIGYEGVPLVLPAFYDLGYGDNGQYYGERLIDFKHTLPQACPVPDEATSAEATNNPEPNN